MITTNDRLVEDLGVPHRAKEAMRALIAAGPAATPAVRAGLLHDDPAVIVGCCDVLDHVLDDDALPELFACLDHTDARVRTRALHALACDNCKEGSCRPAEGEIVRAAIHALDDPDSRVRAAAVGALGSAARRQESVVPSLLRVIEHDPDPGVRKIARWHVPGGPIYEGKRTKSGRLRPRVTSPG